MNYCLSEETGLDMIAGVDEAGRGPLAGDVVAAAVILAPKAIPENLNDSKKLSKKRREQLFDEIIQGALFWHIGRASAAEIDQMNILQATMLAMVRAVSGIPVQPAMVYVDGNRLPAWNYQARAVVKGDAKIASVAAASVLAKVTRDRDMEQLCRQYPGYGFSKHKGYPTREHLEALEFHGLCPVHRRSFGPVARLLGSV